MTTQDLEPELDAKELADANAMFDMLSAPLGPDDPFYYRMRRIPPAVLDALRWYVIGHRRPGGFLIAVLQNDLSVAIARADGRSLNGLAALVMLLINDMPSACWGSEAAVAAWLEKPQDAGSS